MTSRRCRTTLGHPASMPRPVGRLSGTPSPAYIHGHSVPPAGMHTQPTARPGGAMKLKFYGTRGSAPVCEAGFQEFGGNTTCVRLAFPDTQRIAIIDAGTGIRNLGKDLMAMGHRQEQIPIVFSHFHWDHIQGFPFFAPAYDISQTIAILALGQGQTIRNLRGIFEVQMQAQYFPVQLDHMGATFEFLHIDRASEYFTNVNNTVTKLT